MTTVTPPFAPPMAQRHRLSRQLATLAGAELVNRLTRLLTAVTLAWALGPLEFGLAAVALTASDILRALTQTGIGARIVSTEQSQLDSTCNAAYVLNWWAYGSVAVLQAALAFPVAWHFGDERIAWLLILLALPYLFYPMVAVQVYRVQRQARMQQTALMLILLLSGDNLLTALFAVAGFGLWSLAIPKILCAMVWVACYLRLESWKPTRGTGRGQFRATLKFGVTVLFAELAQVLRQQSDKLIIGQMLGLVVLGQYFFAFNAGLGISSALITVASSALLPHFSDTSSPHSPVKRFFKATAMVYALVLPVLALQVLLAPYYVPLVFGAKWASSVNLLMTMCLAAAPLVLIRSTTILLRATGHVRLDLMTSLLHFAAGITIVVAMASHGLQAVVIGQVIVASIIAVGCAIYAVATIRKAGLS